MNSLNLDRTVDRYCQALTYKHVSPSEKLKIIKFLADKFHTRFRLNEERTELLISTLTTLILSGNLSTNQRLAFLTYQNPKVVYGVAYNLYQSGIEHFMPLSSYLSIVKYLMCHTNDEGLKRSLADTLIDLFYEQHEPVRMEIVDILLLGGFREGNRLITTLQAPQPRRERVVYRDTQNVHNSTINQSVLRASAYLVSQSKLKELNVKIVVCELERLMPDSSPIIIKVLHRLKTDTALFSYQSSQFTLWNVFVGLWEFISLQPFTENLKTRLCEELCAMNNYCSSGHLSRLVNVLQGFTTIPELTIRISNYDQIKAVISHYLNRELSQASEDLVQDTDSKDFLLFVQERINLKLNDWRAEYEMSNEDLLRALREYTQHSRWNLTSNGKLTLL